MTKRLPEKFEKILQEYRIEWAELSNTGVEQYITGGHLALYPDKKICVVNEHILGIMVIELIKKGYYVKPVWQDGVMEFKVESIFKKHLTSYSKSYTEAVTNAVGVVYK